MADYRLVWYEGRNTPAVIKSGQTRKKKKGEGKVVKSRPPTAAERKQIAKGQWVRVDKKNRTPGGKGGYGTGSRVRPQFRGRYSG